MKKISLFFIFCSIFCLISLRPAHLVLSAGALDVVGEEINLFFYSTLSLE